MNNRETGFTPERSKEEKLRALNELSLRLGFVETEELKELKKQAVLDLQYASNWREAAEQLVTNLAAKDPDAANLAQLGMLIDQLSIALETDQHEIFFEDLGSAMDLAYGYGQMDVLLELEKFDKE